MTNENKSLEKIIEKLKAIHFWEWKETDHGFLTLVKGIPVCLEYHEHERVREGGEVRETKKSWSLKFGGTVVESYCTLFRTNVFTRTTESRSCYVSPQIEEEYMPIKDIYCCVEDTFRRRYSLDGLVEALEIK